MNPYAKGIGLIGQIAEHNVVFLHQDTKDLIIKANPEITLN